jgi:hypothetical protein
LQLAIEEFERAQKLAKAKQEDYPHAFSEQGGTGYDPRKDPNPKCPECFGEGEEKAFPKDTRDLSPEARRLYAGVKVTKEGLEIKMHSQSEARKLIAQHLGMLGQNVKHSNDPDNPMPSAAVGVVMMPAQREPSDEPGT